MADHEWWNETASPIGLSPRSPGVGRSNSRWRRSAASSFYASPMSQPEESPFGLHVPREQRQTSRQASITNYMMAQAPFGLQVPDIQPRPTSNMYARYSVPSIFENNDIDLAFDFDLPKQQYEKDAEDPYGHLPEEQATILKRQLQIPPVKVKYFDLFRYADKKDLWVVFISAFCAIAAGAALPGMTILFGSLTSEFRGYFQHTTDENTFTSDVDTLALDLVYLGIGQFVATYIYTVGFIWSGEHIAGKIREQYLASILRQNIGYFDKLGAGEITTRITADTNIIQDGISEKVGIVLQALATFFGAYVVGFIKYWKLTIILMTSVVAIFLTTAALSRFVVKYNKLAIECYAEGANIAEEVISSVRNAVAFGTQDKLADKYDEYLKRGERSGFRTKAFQGSIIGIMMAFVYLTFSLGFWLASRYITDGETGLSSVMTIVMAIMIGSFALGNIAPNIQAISAAVAAATKIYATIDRPSPLDPASQEGRRLDVVRGHVELRNVKHIYPSRPEVTVMDDVSLEIPAGKTTALVGASGSGKSTIIGLLERFYDVVQGEVLLDGINVNELNLRWLRQQIALVSQEPTLFATTIAGNIRYGLIGTPFEQLSEEDQQDLIEKAAKMANAHDFICSLGKGYDTHVGERGFLLSGGQKQRIAIARAIVSNPKILLLDEATSALDTKSEGVVQAALDKASEGRTTIVIAHRLSTIRDADNIVVMTKGKIVEQGTHNDLLARKGAYFNLVEAQRIAAEAEDRREEQEIEEAEFSDDTDADQTTEGTIVKKHSEDVDPDDVDLELGRTRSIGAMSASSKALANKQEEKEVKYGLGKLIGVIMSFNKEEWKWMLVGLIFAVLAGAGQPVQSVFFAESVTNLSQPDTTQDEIDDIRSTQDFWSWMYFMLAFVMVITYVGQGTAFAWCSERLVHKARDQAFRYMLRQDIAFFDMEENSAGALTAFLSTETMSLAGMSGATLGTILLVFTTIVVGAIISLVIAWKMAIVCIACIPIIMFTGFMRFYILSRFQQRSKKAYERSAAYACEATSAIRTVAALTREEDVQSNYRKMVSAQEADSIKSVAKSSTLYAASQTSMFLIIALAFYWGSQLITDGYLDMFEYFICFQACVFGAQSAGVIFSYAADMGKAKNAAATMKTLFDRKPEIDTWSKDGEPMESMRGEVEFRDVHFRYPTRTETPVLKGIDMHIQPGMYVALVGSSGCGKSTSISLLERFYNPLVGGIYVDGREISAININDYRKHIALVSQEPTLYAGTIRDNILLGSKVAPEEVNEEDIKRVCKDANIYEFIMSLPEGFDTIVGNKGSMLSGGQKQRIAIARALLREPRILLLDEATSALDSESEKVVQAALDEAAKGRTTIAVAHRLSTIQKADRIYVFDAGHIVEYGTHSELVAKKGRYYELVNLQSLGATK